jgi:hypothetical protein
VLDRVATLPPPGQAQNGWTDVVRRAGRRVAGSVGGVVSRRRVALVVAAVLLALLAAPPVRATIAEWFGFGGVVVERGSPSGPASAPPEVPSDRTLTSAAAEVGFPVSVPTGLGEPDGVEVSADRRLVSMSWSDDSGGVVRLDQFDGRLDFAFAKRTPGVTYASVGAADALWFEEQHEVVLLEADGSRRTESARLAGHTLIWPEGPTTMRLEGELSLARAVEIAESVVPVD